MNKNIDNLIFNTVDNGIIIIDSDMIIQDWNRWLEIFTKTKKENVIGQNICELFPYINQKKLQRKINSVIITNNPSFYAVDPHRYLIDIKLSNITNAHFSSMQQNVTIVPYDIENNLVCIYIYDQTQLCETNLKLNTLNDELRDLSQRDSLTNLFNRRYFTEQSEKIKSFSKRNKHPISIIMLDIDKFKNINDTHGHLIGDQVLIKLSRILESLLRTSDIIARFGGEEFVILLQNVGIQECEKVTYKIRESINKTVLNLIPNVVIKFTSSFGIAQFDEEYDHDNIESTIKRADDALYIAKTTGRNKVVVAEKN